mgnify:CR=1 FL=1
MYDSFNNKLPYDQRNMEQAGRYQGVGQAAKVGLRKGSFVDGKALEKAGMKGKPPRKMN